MKKKIRNEDKVYLYILHKKREKNESAMQKKSTKILSHQYLIDNK